MKTYWVCSENTKSNFDTKVVYNRLANADAKANSFVTYEVPDSVDTTYIPDRIRISNDSLFELDWFSEGIRYTGTMYNGTRHLQKIIEHITKDNTLNNKYGPASILFLEPANNLSLKYCVAQDIGMTTREQLKRLYEVTHLETIDSNHKIARLLADDATKDNHELWINYIYSFERQRNVDLWMTFATTPKARHHSPS